MHIHPTALSAEPNRAHARSRGAREAALLALIVVGAGVGMVSGARAAPPVLSMPGEEDFQPDLGAASESALLDDLARLDRSALLLGNMGGLRSALSRQGISLAIQETSEVLANPSGGARAGAVYDGLTQMLLQMDTGRAFGWYGGTFNASALQIHGGNFSQNNLMSLQTSSGITAERSTRLWELWYQQKFLDEDRLDVRFGQQSLDQEFIASQNASYFMNTMFGWPMVPSADLPGGGPAYPLSALGVRVRARPIDSLTFLLGVFNGSPAPGNNGDPQRLNPSGTSFALNGGVLVIGEMQFTHPSVGAMISPDGPAPLSGVYKLGFYYDSQSFADQQFDTAGMSLADPAGNGVPGRHRGDFSVYAVADQLLWVDPREGDRTVSLFARVMGAPQADRNLITFSANAGLTMHEPFLHRDADTLGIGMGLAKVSGDAGALDKATAFYGSGYVPIRGSETYVEVTYQYQATAWLQLQPDVQYVFTPGGGLANPNDPTRRIGNALVLGVRTNILF